MIKTKNFRGFLLKTAVGAGVFMCTLFFMAINSTLAQELPEIKSETHKEESFVTLNYSTDTFNPLFFEKQEDFSIPENDFEAEYTSQIKKTNYRFNAIGPYWTADIPDGASLKVEIRLYNENDWSEWHKSSVNDTESGRDGGEEDEEVFGELIFGEGADSYQYRIILERTSLNIDPHVYSINFNYIDSTQEKDKSILEEASAAPSVVSRAGWGCPEANYSPNWPPQKVKATHAIIHHTAGTWNTSDPKSTVRAIWSYHAYTRGWGDIGYNYLIDGYGNIYEGRYGGENVVAGHAYPYNRGSIGVAVMGYYVDYSISSSARNSLANLLAREFGERFINPSTGAKLYAKNTVTAASITDYWGRSYVNTIRIISHRNVAPTACPGSAFYSTLGTIRSLVSQRYLDYFPVNFVTSDSTSTIYALKDNVKYPIPSLSVFDQWKLSWSYVENISNVELTGYQTGVNISDAVKAEDNTLYLIDKGKRYKASQDIFDDYGFLAGRIADLPNNVFSAINDNVFQSLPSTTSLTNLAKIASASAVYYMENGEKRHVLDGDTLDSLGGWSQVKILSGYVLDNIPEGSPMANIVSGVLAKTLDSGKIYLVDSNKKYPIPNIETFVSWGFSWSSVKTISQQGLDVFTTDQSLTTLAIDSINDVYLIDSGKRYYVSGAKLTNYGFDWGDIIDFSDQTIGKVRASGALKEMAKGSLSTVYFLENGYRRSVPNPAVLIELGGWNNVVYLSDFNLNKITLESFYIPDGFLIRAYDLPEVYYIDSGQRFHVASGDVFDAYGFSWGDVILVSESVVLSFPDGGVLNYP